MLKDICLRRGLAFLVAALVAVGTVGDAASEVRVNVNIGPPPIVVSAPPAVVLVPGSSVYFVPEFDFDIFFYDGYWWSPRGERWYRSRSYDGPWKVISRRSIPRPVYRVPKDYRQVYVRERRIPYGQWKKGGRDHDRGRGGGPKQHKGRDDNKGRGDHGGRGH